MNLRVLASVRAATNCRYFFISVVWSTTVGLGAGTKAMVAARADWAAVRTGLRDHRKLMYTARKKTQNTHIC